MKTHEEILALLNTDDAIPRSRITGWMKTEDIRVLGALYRLTSKAYYRIKPDLGMEASCDLILNYFTRCMVENPHAAGDNLYSRYEAGSIMAEWMKHLWMKRPQTEKVLEKVRDTLAEFYLLGNADVQGCIVYAVMENAFSEEGMRIFFKEWRKKPKLREAYDTALAYAKKLEEVPESVMKDVMNKMGKQNA